MKFIEAIIEEEYIKVSQKLKVACPFFITINTTLKPRPPRNLDQCGRQFDLDKYSTDHDTTTSNWSL